MLVETCFCHKMTHYVCYMERPSVGKVYFLTKVAAARKTTILDESTGWKSRGRQIIRAAILIYGVWGEFYAQSGVIPKNALTLTPKVGNIKFVTGHVLFVFSLLYLPMSGIVDVLYNYTDPLREWKRIELKISIGISYKRYTGFFDPSLYRQYKMKCWYL